LPSALPVASLSVLARFALRIHRDSALRGGFSARKYAMISGSAVFFSTS